MKVSHLIPLFYLLSSIFASQAQDTIESKGAIIIASLEGQVTVVNNETQAPLPASQVKAGGLLIDGHTVKTGPASKVILLLSNGTVSTIKSDSSLNIKKFTQAKFDSKGKKLSEMKGEPSASETVLDLELGDMVFDVKKLDKRSSFNIESPVGTAGIRGTSGQMGISNAAGATNLNINMFKGSVAAQLRGQTAPTMVRQGQSFAAGISANGVMLPPVLGKVPPTILAAIEADLETSGDLTGVSSVDDPVVPVGEGGEDVEDEAPSEEELQEQDAEQAAAAKGVDDNGSTEAVAMDKAGLIDLNDPDKLEKVETYVKVSRKGADKLDVKIKERRSGRRAEGDKDDSQFLTDLVGNFDDVVDVTVEAETIGLESEAMFESLLENSENSGAVKEVVTVAAEIGVKDKDNLSSVFVNVDQADAVKEVVTVASEIGAKDKDNLGSVFKNADKAEDLKEVVTVASEIGAKDVTNLGSVLKNADKADSLNKVMKVAKEAIGTEATPGGEKKLDSSSLDILSSTLQNADKATELAEVMDVAADLGAQDATNLTNVFKNADKADSLNKVMKVAKKTLGSGDGEEKKLDSSSLDILSSTLQNADKAADLAEVMDAAADLGAQDATNLTNVFKNADKADSLNKVMKVAKETLGSGDGEEKKLDSSSLDILSSTLQNADKAADLAEVMDAAADLGAQSAENLTSVFQNADKANDLKEVMNAAKDSLGTDDGSGVKKLDQSQASFLTDTLKNADKASEMKAATDQLSSLGSDADAASLFTNLVDVGTVIKKAKDNGQDNTDFIKNVAGNANIAKEMKAAAEQLEELGDDADSASFFTNIVEVGSIVKKAQDSGVEDTDFVKNMARNADIAKEMNAAAQQLDELGTDADAASLFTNIVDVGKVVKKAKDSGVEDAELIRNMTKNPDKAKKVQEVFDTVGTGIDSDAAKNILGNVENVDEIKTALDNVDGKVADLGAFIKKDITELEAVNEVVESLGGNADAFLNQGIDDVLQVKELLDNNLIAASDFDSEAGADPIDFTQVVKNKSLTKLQDTYSSNADYLDIITVNDNRAEDILFVTNLIKPDQESAFFGNIDKLDAIMHLSHKFRPIQAKEGASLTEAEIQSNITREGRLNIVFQNLDVVDSLDELVTEFGVYPSRMDIIFQNADLAPSILGAVREYEGTGNQPNPDAGRLIETLFSSSENLRNTLSNEGLQDLIAMFPEYSESITENGDIAAEINGLISMVGEKHAKSVIENLERFDDVEKLVFRSGQKTDNLDALFRNLHRMNEILDLSNSMNAKDVAGGQNALFSNLDLLFGEQAESGYLLLANDNPKFFVKLFEQSGDLRKVSPVLATELEALDLGRDELTKVLADLIDGPSSDAPTTAPPTDEGLSQEFAAVTILETHAFNGEIPQGLVLSEQQVRASGLFQETLDVYDALGELSLNSETDTQPDTSTGLVGGVNLIFDSGSYDLSNYGFGSYLIAASESISLSGNLSFAASQNVEELMFISSGPFKISEGSSVDFSGNSLGFGSFDTIEMINVGLYAGSEIGVRSLDSITIKDSEFATRGTGADHIHLIAAAELAIDNLRFSEQVRQITMEAMTINLSNLNFPSGSIVDLRSEYGGIDGIYPNFGTSAPGRVNFIQNVKYNSHLINSRAAFDTHGSNISIGVTGN